MDLPMLLVSGAIAGTLAGLLGIGGGIIIVPIVTLLFETQGLAHGLAIKMALGTSLATIVLTSISSAWAHHRKGALHWELVPWFVPGLVLGAVGGAALAVWLLVRGARERATVFLCGHGGDEIGDRARGLTIEAMYEQARETGTLEAFAIGLRLNNWLTWDRNEGLAAASHIPPGRTVSAREARELVPGLEHRGLTGAAVWSDAQASSTERLGLAFVLAAAL